jgi:hypothetical protein
MVDALRRARELLLAGGYIADIHPTPELAHLELQTDNQVENLGDRPDGADPTSPALRHRAADAAIATCVDAGVLSNAAETECSIHTYADSVDELRTWLDMKWKQPPFDERTFQLANEALARETSGRLRVREQVRFTRLLPTRR